MRIRNFILGLGILIVFALALWQGMEAFYPSPQYNDYCDYQYRNLPTKADVNCSYPSDLDSKQNACYKIGGEFRYDYDENGCIIGGYCDDCSIKYNDASDIHSRNVFIISLIIGVLALIVGFSILSVEPVGSALLASGIWSVFYGTVINWRNFGNSLRFIILAVILLVLIWIALRLNKKSKKGFFLGIRLGKK